MAMQVNTLIYKDEKVQVFKNEEHLRENVDYQVAEITQTFFTHISH